eukprot:g25597.t1
MEQDAETFRPAKRLKAALAPNVFAQFTALAKQHGAANLGQGFPSFGSPRFLQDAVMKAMQGDVFATTGAPESLGNQYTRPGGEPNLAETLARLYGPRFNRTLDPLKEIVTTIGAQEAIFTSLFSWTDPGDEVLLFTPCFDAVVRSASTLQVKLIGVNLRPPCDGSTASLKDWSVNMEELERSITPQTRILMFNTPSAPFGKVFRQEELEAIAEVPPYGFALLYSRWEVTGAARRIQNCTPREICRLLHHTTWCVPAVTYVIIRVVEHREETYDSQMGLFSILVIHYVVSAIGIGIGLFYPIWDSDAIWPLTRVSVLTQFSRFVFWGLVLMVKCVLAYYGLISKMLRSVSKLRLSQYSSSHVFAQAGWRGLLLNAPLSRDFVEECGIWGAAFFLFFADTLLWFILGCTILGVGYVFVQRRGRIRSFVCEEGELELLTGNGHAPQPSPMGQAIAKSIWEWRICLAIGWPLLAVLMAPFAYMMVINALPLPKNPPHGTPSALAEELFEAKFPYLVGMKMEMVLIKCRAPCESAVSSVSKSHVEILKDRFEGTIIDIRSYYTFGTKIDDNPMLSFDKQSILFVWSWRVNGTMKLEAQDFARQITRMCDSLNEQLDDGPLSYQLAATGPTFLNVAMKETVPIHEIETLWLPFGILAYRLQSARLLLLALCSMPVSILISFGFMYFVSTQLPVILYALVMMLMLCTALSFDYSLFTMTRYGEERRKGTSLEDAIAIVITQSGHVVVVSGLVLTIAYGSLLVLPGAFKSFCIAACSMILCCIGVQMTFVPCLLGIFPWLGAGFDVVSPEEEADEGDEEEEEDIGHEELEEDTPATRNSLRHVRVFRKGIYYRVGGKLTQNSSPKKGQQSEPLCCRLIPFKLLFTVILPITWTYGAALYVYEDGALEWLGFPGLSPTYITNSGPAGLDWTDYDVFLFERVWEFREEGFGDNESVQLALSATGPTITAAGLIFAFTFTSMLLGSMAITNQMGFIFIFSIVVDTFVDSVSKIQQRFPAKVLPYALQGPGGPPYAFYGVWDRIVEFLRYEGKVWENSLRCETPPQIFRGTRLAENLLRKYTSQGQQGWPNNREAKWRLQALARGLGLPLPVPYRAPYVPGLSVLIPHYGESILAEKQLELLRECHK